jgi:hypothetical protein
LVERRVELGKRVRRLAAVPVGLLLSLGLFAAVTQATVNLSGLVAAPAPAGQGGTTQAGAASTFHLHVNLSSQPPGDDLRNLTFHLPPGLVGNPTAAALCLVSHFDDDNCPAGSRVGVSSTTQEVETGIPQIGDLDVTISGDVYNVVPAAGQPGRLGIVLRPQPLSFEDVTVGTLNVITQEPCETPGTFPGGDVPGTFPCAFVRADVTTTSPKQFLLVPVTIRPGDLGLDNTLGPLPRTVNTTAVAEPTRLCLSNDTPGFPPAIAPPNPLACLDVAENELFPGSPEFPIDISDEPAETSENTLDIRLRSIDTRLFAHAPSGAPFITNPTSCGPAVTRFDARSYRGDVSTGSAGFTVTGCAAAPPPAAPPPAAPPSNDFSFGKVKLNKRKGTAKLTINIVEGPGELDLAKTKKVKADDEPVEGQGATAEKLAIKPTGKAKKKLNDKGKAKVTVNVTYAPTGTGGTPNTESKKIKLVKR